MPKYLTVLFRAPEADASALHDHLAAEAPRRAAELGATRLAFNVEGGPPSPIARTYAAEGGARAAPSTVIAALVSAELPDATSARAFAAGLTPSGCHHAVYRVTEAIPVDYTRTWALGGPSPGLKQVTFLRRKAGMTYDEFIAYWHGTHTPLAIEIHPLFRYVRNVVEEALTEGAPPFEGIVELHFRALEDVTDVLRFYGGDKRNVKRIAEDVRNFIDFDTIDIAHMHETVVKE